MTFDIMLGASGVTLSILLKPQNAQNKINERWVRFSDPQLPWPPLQNKVTEFNKFGNLALLDALEIV